MLVIDETGRNLGKISLEAALGAAKEKGLDLIEVSPQARPPVARIVDFDKYRYEQEKKLRKSKSGQKELDIKQVQISGRAADNDLRVKAKQANKFLEKGHVVRIVLTLRGREKAHKDFAREKLLKFLEEQIIPHKVIMPPKPGGRGFITQIQK